MWEDARNKQGGRWLLSFEKRGGGGRDRDRDVEKRELKEVLDNCWMETVGNGSHLFWPRLLKVR